METSHQSGISRRNAKTSIGEIIKIKKFDIKEALIRRAYQGKPSDKSKRLLQNRHSDDLISKISEYWDRASETSDNVINHGDLSTNNLILGDEVTFFDHRLIYAPQGFLDQSVFLMQPEINLSADKKLDIICKECNLNFEQAAISLLANGLCELGAHLGQGKIYNLEEEFAELGKYAEKTSLQPIFQKYQDSISE